MDLTFIDTYNWIRELEIELQLNAKTMDSYPVWGKIRTQINMNRNYSSKNVNRRKHVKNYSQLFTVFKNRALNMKESDVLVILGHRKIKDDTNKFEDPITIEIREILDKKGIYYNMIDPQAFNGKHYMEFKDNLYNVGDLLLVKRIMRKKIVPSEKTLEQMNIILSKIKDMCEIKLEDLIFSYKEFVIETEYYDNILRNSKIKHIYLPMHYSYLPLIHAAKRLGIKTNEIQYATITKDHINFDFSHEEKVEYLPDSLVLWSSNYYKDFLRYEEYYYIEKKITKINSTNKKNKLVIISQDVVAKKMYDQAINIKEHKFFKDWKVVLKQHPWERPIKENEQYEKIKSLDIEIISSDEFIKLDKQLIDAKVVISSFSSGIDEALQLDCEVYTFEDTNNSYITKIKTVDELVTEISKNNKKVYHPFENNDSNIKLETVEKTLNSDVLRKQTERNDINIEIRDLLKSKVKLLKGVR